MMIGGRICDMHPVHGAKNGLAVHQQVTCQLQTIPSRLPAGRAADHSHAGGLYDPCLLCSLPITSSTDCSNQTQGQN